MIIALRRAFANTCRGADTEIRTAQAPLAGLLIAIAVVAAAQVVARTAAHGPAAMGDSVIIAATAEHLHAGNGLANLRGRGLLVAPPLYPGLLAAGRLAGLTTDDAARVVNAAAVGALALVAGAWLAGNIRSRLLAAGAAAMLTVCGPIAHFAASLHSGALFALFTLLALTQLAQTPNTPRHRRRAALFTMLAAATEFAGVALLVTGVVIVLSRPLDVRDGERAPAGWRAAALFGAIASWPLVAVLLHNAAVFGVALPSPDQWRAGYEAFAAAPTDTVARRWPAGDQAEYWLYALLTLLGLAGARMGRRRQLWVFAVFACVYALAALAGLTSGFAGDSGSARLLPLLGPALLAAALLLDATAPTPPRPRWTRDVRRICAAGGIHAQDPATEAQVVATRASGPTNSPDKHPAVPQRGPGGESPRNKQPTWAVTPKNVAHSWTRIALTIAAGAMCVVGAKRELTISLNAVERGYSGRAYNTPHWREKGMIPHLLRHGLSSGYSNRPNLLLFSLGINAGDAAGGRYLRLPRDLADLPATLAAEATIVWFYDAPPEYGFGIAELLDEPSISTLFAFRNGALLKWRRPPKRTP